MSTFYDEQLQKGIKIEMEHTKNLKIAEKIASDHLKEIPNYYDLLEHMEKEELKEIKKGKKMKEASIKILKKDVVAALAEIGAEIVDGKVKLSDILKITASEDAKEDQKLTWEKKLLKEALEVQNAVNILGVSKGFARAIQDLYEHVLDRSGMCALKSHPVTVLWVDKILDLAGRPEMKEISAAMIMPQIN